MNNINPDTNLSIQRINGNENLRNNNRIGNVAGRAINGPPPFIQGITYTGSGGRRSQFDPVLRGNRN